MRITGTHRTDGGLHSVSDLVAAIYDFIKVHNENPKRFVWTKKVDQILQKVTL